MKINLQEVLDIEAQENHAVRVYMAAMMYARQGIRFLPIVPNGKSLPEKSSGISYYSASNKVDTAKRWFDPESGKYAGYNIGIATGFEGGVFAIDVDCKEDKRGDLELAELVEQFGEIDGPVAETPSGGKHYLVLWEENAASSNGKIANGIDTRGGDKARSTGHIVAFPSQIDGRSYKWIRGGEIVGTPDWIMDRLGVLWTKKQRDPSFKPMEEVIPEEQLSRMLGCIDPNDLEYDQWMKIGMAIKTQYPGDFGLKAWDEWSKKGQRYKRGECHIRWAGFDEDGMVRSGTLFYLATSHGWVPQQGDVTPFTSNTKIEVSVAEMNKDYAVVCIGKSVKIIRTINVSELDPERRLNGDYDAYKILDVDSFRILASTQKIMLFDGEKMKQKNLCDIWLSHPSRREYIHGTGFYPSGAPDGKFNLWQGFSVDPVPGEPSLYLKHLRYVICRDNDEVYTWLLDWMADAVQDTCNLKGCAVIVRGQEGSGKGIFADYFGRLFGHHYRHLLDVSHLTGNFNAHMAGAAVIFADEVFWPGNRQMANKLKGLTTEKKIQVERKGVDVEPMENMGHIIIASNEDWVVPAGPQSRRWLVLESSNIMTGNKEYFDELVKSMGIEGMGKLLWFLQNRKITSNLNVAPQTKWLRAQRNIEAEAHDPVARWLRIKAEQGALDTPDVRQNVGDDVRWPGKVPSSAIYSEFVDWSKYMGFRGKEIQSSELFKSSMEKYGFTRTRGSAGIFYLVPELAELREKFSYEE